MHQPNFTKALAFFGLFFLGLITVSAASPTFSIPAPSSPLGELLRNETKGALSRRDDIIINEYPPCTNNPTGCVDNIPVCKTNYGDSNMCTVTYLTHSGWGWVRPLLSPSHPEFKSPLLTISFSQAGLQLWDNNCHYLGGLAWDIPYFAFQTQPQGYALGSWLPYTVNIFIQGDPSDASSPNFMPYLWYAGFGMQEPIVGLDYNNWVVIQNIDGYTSATLPFKCH
ncbi:hypothetical protein N431DRAFT_525345 [Stipitochalara longipes BDJ]|nr:hypothetical protein N431DRAFT_525345 [Stipitochalara longipes BDJ]